VALSLVAVGAASGTVLRHFVPVAPVLLAALVASGVPTLAAAASIPIFAIQLALIAAIWTFLPGKFPPFELSLNALIAASCVLGGIAALRLETAAPLARRIAALVAFAALQLGALWLSFRPA
jgi:hypothetical protein